MLLPMTSSLLLTIQTAAVVANMLTASQDATNDYITGILNAPESVTVIARYLVALKSVLHQLDEQVKKPAFVKNSTNVEIVPLVEKPLENCTSDSQQI